MNKVNVMSMKHCIVDGDRVVDKYVVALLPKSNFAIVVEFGSTGLMCPCCTPVESLPKLQKGAEELGAEAVLWGMSVEDYLHAQCKNPLPNHGIRFYKYCSLFTEKENFMNYSVLLKLLIELDFNEPEKIKDLLE